MEYVFTDWDNRSYKRKSKEKISIEAVRGGTSLNNKITTC